MDILLVDRRMAWWERWYQELNRREETFVERNNRFRSVAFHVFDRVPVIFPITLCTGS